VRTEVTQVPHPGNGDPNSGSGSTGGGGDGPTNSSGDESGGGPNPSGGAGLSPEIIAAIIIGAVLALALLVFFLRKRVRKHQATQRTRWLSSSEKGPRNTLRSSFGDLRASSLGHRSEDDHDNRNSNRYSGPFSDTMAAPPPSFASADSPTPQMTQFAYTDITPPPTAMHSTGRGSSRNSVFSIGSAESGGTDSSEGQWLEIHPDVRYSDRSEWSPADQFRLPSPISVRPFTPSESWSFPKPPTSRAEPFAWGDKNEGILSLDPFADPVPQLPPAGFLPVEMAMRDFEPKVVGDLAVESGDEVSVGRVL
jgi:hypothetical protein